MPSKLKSRHPILKDTNFATGKTLTTSNSKTKLPTYLLDESSSSDNDRERFLKKKPVNSWTQKARPYSPSNSEEEEENTDDLLVPLNVTKDSKRNLRNLSINKSSITPSSKHGNISTSLSENKTRSHKLPSSGSVVNDFSMDSDNDMDEMLVIHETDHHNEMPRLSVVSFVDDLSNSVYSNSVHKMTDSKSKPLSIMSLYDEKLVLSLEEFEKENLIPEVEEQNSEPKSTMHADAVKSIESVDNESVSEIEENLDYSSDEWEDDKSYTKTYNMNADSPKSSTKQYSTGRMESDTENQVSSHRKLTSDHSGSSTELDQYSDDFEPEECICEESVPVISLKDDHSKIRKQSKSSSCEDNSNEISEMENISKHERPKTSKILLSNKRDTERYSCTSVEVQTAWTGDFSPQPDFDYRQPHFAPNLQHFVYTPLETVPITPFVVNIKALEDFTTYNPCLVALDNMLKQQVNMTREFLSTQRNLHDAISRAIGQCVNRDYPTLESTLEIMKMIDKSRKVSSRSK